jgi:hypothetical protein
MVLDEGFGGTTLILYFYGWIGIHQHTYVALQRHSGVADTYLTSIYTKFTLIHDIYASIKTGDWITFNALDLSGSTVDWHCLSLVQVGSTMDDGYLHYTLSFTLK